MFKRRMLVLGCAIALVGSGAVSASADPAAPVSVPVVAVADAPNLAGVVDPVKNYVTWVYADLFGRYPDAAGLESWTALLKSGTPRVAVANSITSSTEFRSGLITDSYSWYLGRSPDAGGLAYWLGQMGAGWTVARMEAGFIASDEFYAKVGGTPVTWVNALYGAVLDRSAAQGEVDYWTGRLAAGANRGTVAMGFLLSTEQLSTVVNGYYNWMLGRDLDVSGQRYWVGILQGGGRDEVIIGGIVASDEYWNMTQES